MTYTKYLVARFSPKNGCNAVNGEILFVKPLRNVPITNVHPYFFIGTSSKKRSKFGWVAESDRALSLEEFVVQSGIKSSGAEMDAARTMLDSIRDLSVDVPVGCDYRKDGLSSRMSLWIHRVRFYPTPDSLHLSVV